MAINGLPRNKFLLPTRQAETEDHGLGKSDVMLKEMRLDLITGAFDAGARVKIQELTDKYDVSQTTVREVLPKLAAEGLLVGLAQKGYKVSAMSLDDLNELTALRLDLELPALRESLEYGDDTWEFGVLRAQHVMRRYLADHSDVGMVELTRGWIDVHADFHAALIAGCPSVRRRQYCRQLFDQSSRYFWLAASRLPSSKSNVDDHIALADLALARNLDAALEQLRIHIEKAYESIRGTLVDATA